MNPKHPLAPDRKGQPMRWLLAAVLIVLLVGVLILSPNLAAAGPFLQAATDDETSVWESSDEPMVVNEVRFAGVITSVPAGLVGDWTIGGKTVHTDATTSVNPRRAPAQAGNWAGVRALKQDDGSLFALRIDILPPIVRLEGPILSMDDATGVWNIAGQQIKVNNETRINERMGPAVVGAWVEVQAQEQGDGSLLALRIAVIEPKEDVSGFGAIQEVAADRWVVSRMTFSVIVSTTIRGPAEVGLLARFHGSLENNALVAEGIKVEWREAERPHLEPVVFQGVIESLPTGGLIGEWVVSGRRVMVDVSTEINQNKGPVEIGASVHVEAMRQSNGSLLATRIVVLARPALSLVHLKGVIKSMPASGFVGEWVIHNDDGDHHVQVSERTWVDEHAGVAKVGAPVQVEALRRADGSLWALRIKVIGDGAARIVRFRGPILHLPDAPNFIGTWLVGMQRVVVTRDTEIDQTEGAVRLGAWVEVVGTQKDHDPVHALRIKVLPRPEITPTMTRTPHPTRTPTPTHDPSLPTRTPTPTRTPRPTMTAVVQRVEFEGRIESRPPERNGLWRIAGRDVMVTAQTEIDQSHGPAVVGAWVKVEGWQVTNTGPVMARKIKVKAPPTP
ncbi:MAG: hypothetical protein IT330_12595 [Anaerolineae bacterium]|nr:hypothetical protein [Anaerolineae bacterium]